jgi:hypothetical protein
VSQAAPPIAVIHLVSADVPEHRLAVLRSLLGQSGAARGGSSLGIPEIQEIVWLGAGSGTTGLPKVVRQARLPWPVAAVRRFVLEPAIRDVENRSGGPVVVHIWSAAWAEVAAGLSHHQRRLLVEIDAEYVARKRCRGACAALATSATLWATCSQAVVEHVFATSGADAMLRLGPSVESAEVETALTRRTAVRAQLELSPVDKVILALPPVSRASGSLLVAWASFLVEKIRNDVRLLVPWGGREHARVRRLTEACGHQGMVRFAPRGTTWAELVAAADVGVFLPGGLADVTGLATALVARLPVVATAAAVVREAVQRVPDDDSHPDGDAPLAGVRFCSATPAAAAREILHLVEVRDAARRSICPAAAREFAAPRVVEAYLRAYARLTAPATFETAHGA